MKSFDLAKPRIVFDASTGSVSGWLETLYKNGDGFLTVADTINVDPERLVLEYPGRCLETQKRNPDMPKKQTIEIALRQWALELKEKENVK